MCKRREMWRGRYMCQIAGNTLRDNAIDMVCRRSLRSTETHLIWFCILNKVICRFRYECNSIKQSSLPFLSIIVIISIRFCFSFIQAICNYVYLVVTHVCMEKWNGIYANGWALVTQVSNHVLHKHHSSPHETLKSPFSVNQIIFRGHLTNSGTSASWTDFNKIHSAVECSLDNHIPYSLRSTIRSILFFPHFSTEFPFDAFE